MNLKQAILGSFLGRIAVSSREKLELARACMRRPESLGTIANDQLAGHLIASLCRSQMVFLDIGAHIGSVVSAVQLHDASVKIIAVEAIPEKAERLRTKFPNITVHACAAGEVAGETDFFIDTQQTGYSSLISTERPSTKIRKIRVQVDRLDDLISADTAIDAVKIDIEGAEVGALRGATRIVSGCKPTVMFESAPVREGSSYTTSEIYDYFTSRDFVIVVPNRLAHNDDGLSQEGFLESHLYPRRTTNYFAVHKDRRMEIRDRAREILGMR